MIRRIKSNNIILDDKIIKGYVYYSDGVILDVTDKDMPYDDETDASELFVSPGFIDIHTHGGGGASFADGTAAVVTALKFHLSHGTTSIIPTVSAAPLAEMALVCEYIKEAVAKTSALPFVIGAHLEGPYLSRAQNGAQSASFITPPNADEYIPILEKYKDLIARVTYAPEEDEDALLAECLSRFGILPSAGHTDARYSDMMRAYDKGCRLVTHLYSCTSTVTREGGFRFPGVIETALLDDGFYAEIIADGKHLPLELIKLVLKCKGKDKVILVTDSLPQAGSEAQSGRMGEIEYIIEDGVCKLRDRSAFAGSIATADSLVRTMINDVGVPICDAVRMISKNPARLFGLNKGELARGLDADILIFDGEINVRGVIVNGNKII